MRQNVKLIVNFPQNIADNDRRHRLSLFEYTRTKKKKKKRINNEIFQHPSIPGTYYSWNVTERNFANCLTFTYVNIRQYLNGKSINNYCILIDSNYLKVC